MYLRRIKELPPIRFRTPKNLEKALKIMLFEVLKILKGLFQKSLKRGAGVEPLRFTIEN
jgi:hypothetical protein